jgi:hypothetical protein
MLPLPLPFRTAWGFMDELEIGEKDEGNLKVLRIWREGRARS